VDPCPRAAPRHTPRTRLSRTPHATSSPPFPRAAPAATAKLPEDYVARVQSMHEVGGAGSGSIGYRYDWKRTEADKNLLRTHTTAVSARMLYALANVSRVWRPAGGDVVVPSR
jgi:hypothetical protein